MGVVFDEVVGNVVPADSPNEGQQEQHSSPAEPEEVLIQRLRYQVHLLAKRRARLCAD